MLIVVVCAWERLTLVCLSGKVAACKSGFGLKKLASEVL